MEITRCLCGCGKSIDTSHSRGKTRRYFDEACKKRYQRSHNDNRDTKRDTVQPIPIRKVDGPVLKYPGAKWMLAQWIIDQFPEHTTYIEPYFGSGAVFFGKKPADYEIINDLDEQVVNLFRVIREQGEQLAWLIEMTPWSRAEYYRSYEQTGDPLEDARRFLVRCWQAHGVKTSDRTGWMNRGPKANGSTTSRWAKLPERIVAAITRLKQAEIECTSALELIARYRDAQDCLIYADPPYVTSTRTKKMYKNEMCDTDHLALLDALDEHTGPVVLSGYAHPLYDERLKHWQRVTCTTTAEKGQARIEVLWLNRKASRIQLSLFDQAHEA